MTTVVLGCDSNDVDDATCQKTVHDAIKSAGFEVKDLGINPNDFANYSYSGEAKGKIGVYLMAASLISFLDASDAGFDYNILGIRGDVTGWSNEQWKSKPVPKDHDGNYSHPRYDECAGKTYPQLNELFKGKCVAVPGENPQDLAKNIVSALNGSYIGSSNNDNQNQEEDEEEEWDDKDNFTPHKGKIMEIKPYKEISSISFDKSYDSPTGSGNVEILFNSKDYRFIYKGVAMKLKLRRSCDGEFSATGVEEPDYDEDEKFFKEHIPTNELLEELGLPNYRKELKTNKGGASTGGDSSLTGGVDGTDGLSGGSEEAEAFQRQALTGSVSGGSSATSSARGSYNSSSSSSSGGKRGLSRAYINTLTPSHASTLARRTGEFNTATIKALRRRAMGLYW